MAAMVLAVPPPLLLAAALPALLAAVGEVHAGNVGLSLRTEPIGAEEGGAAQAKTARVLEEPGHRARHRKPKFITFSTDSSQIGVELGFTVPLLKVPLQGARASGAAEGPEGPGMPGGALFKQPITVNVGALFVAGSMLLTVMGIVPSLYQAFSKPARPHGLHARSVGAEALAEAEEAFPLPRGLWVEAGGLLQRADEALARRGVDARVCGGRALCAALAGAAARVRRGAAGSMDLVLHGVARSPWVSQWVTGTALQDAASGAEDPDHCANRFAHCELPSEIVSLLGAGPERASNSIVD